MRSFIISKNSSAKISRQKSSFFAYVFSVRTIEECKRKIDEVKRKHKADHFPFAYHLTSVDKKGDISILLRQSDDGEPSHTAGSPLLNLIDQKDLTNTIIIVARVFGGIKLGPSGLTRAFRESAILALQEAKTAKFIPTITYVVVIPQERAHVVDTWCKQNKIKCTMERNEPNVLCTIAIPLTKKSLLSDAQQLK